jgi:O-antigen ligase
MLSYLIVVLYALTPVTLLTSHSLPSALFYLTAVLALALLVKQRFVGGLEQTIRYWPLIAGYGVLFAAVAISSLVHGHWAGANSEGALRFFLGLWVFILALPHINKNLLRHTLWGIFLAGLISGVIVLWLSWTVRMRPDTPALILTTYSSITLLCAAISIYALKYPITNKPGLECTLKIGVACVAFAGFAVAQTRTGLLGLPILIVISVLLFVSLNKPLKLVGAILVACTIFAGVLLSNDGIRSRVIKVYDEAITCQTENVRTSTCVRLQLWRAAIDAGKNNPWVGLGNGSHFDDYVENVAVPKGLAAPFVVDIHFGEPHNDVLMMFAAFGVPGALGLLLIYIVPAIYFAMRLTPQHASQIRAAATRWDSMQCLWPYLSSCQTGITLVITPKASTRPNEDRAIQKRTTKEIDMAHLTTLTTIQLTYN